MSKIIPLSLKREKKQQSSVPFEEFVLPYMDDLYQAAYRLCGNRYDAEDLLQTVLTKLYIKEEKLRKVEKPVAWLLKVLYRQFIDLGRQETTHTKQLNALEADPALQPDSATSTNTHPDSVLDSDLLGAQLQQAIIQLPEIQRVLVVMHDVESYSMQEIAEILDIPEGTVKSRLHRARVRLREILRENGTFS